ncbi:hypothetical protein FKM82_029517 [Ascaphus truei]
MYSSIRPHFIHESRCQFPRYVGAVIIQTPLYYHVLCIRSPLRQRCFVMVTHTDHWQVQKENNSPRARTERGCVVMASTFL